MLGLGSQVAAEIGESTDRNLSSIVAFFHLLGRITPVYAWKADKTPTDSVAVSTVDRVTE